MLAENGGSMIFQFKKSKERYVYDSGSGVVSSLSALQYKMLSYVAPPLGEELPTALRYDLAKFDGGAVSEAYEGLYKLYSEGKLFSNDDASPEECEKKFALVKEKY